MDFAEQLKSQLNIVDVIGQYVRLKRAGAREQWKGLCPFHSEKTPSFNVNGALGFYYCFGCQAGGDLFRFVMEHDHLSFVEAMRMLANRYGIAMPDRQQADDPEAQRRAALLDLHEQAAEIFQRNLESSRGDEARAYLAKRGVTEAAIREFRIGLSEAGGQQLAGRFQRFGPTILEVSGLVMKRAEGGGFFDRFRGRLMFPIHSESGKVIAFGGRAMRPGDEPKYLNSPETAIYKKSMVLFNLHRAKMDARKSDRMLLVEGYMDVIAVYSAGVHEVVASSGTALSQEQVRHIKRQIALSDANRATVILNFDPDPAGERSTEKYIQTALAEGLRVRVLKIPGGLDPDEYIQLHGAAAYRELLQRSESYFHWLADRARQRFDLTTAEGRVDAFRLMQPALDALQDRVERGAIAAELAQYLQVDLELIRQTLRKPDGTRSKKAAVRVTDAIPPNEKLLLLCLLASNDARAAVRTYLEHSSHAESLEYRSIFEALLTTSRDGDALSIETALAGLSERDQKILTELTFFSLPIGVDSVVQQSLDCLEALENTAGLRRRDDLKRGIRQAEKDGDMGEVFRLAEILHRLERATQISR